MFLLCHVNVMKRKNVFQAVYGVVLVRVVKKCTGRLVLGGCPSACHEEGRQLQHLGVVWEIFMCESLLLERGAFEH